MCGIAGLVTLDPTAGVDPGVAVAMADCLAHRGPDAGGHYVDPAGSASLAFRRLSIIDLSTGMQPIGNEDGSIHVVCNGEIYNFKALREELTRRGHRFATAGDIEPIVHLYEEYGLEFLERLDGFFGLALYDAKRQRLILAVDRVGKKPLYYAVVRNQLHFASELKSIRTAAGLFSINKQSLIDYLRFGYIPAPETVYRDVYKVPPGHRLEVCLDYHRRLACSAVGPCVRYWEPRSERWTEDYPAAKERLTQLLTAAVTKRLVADVPLGVLLSGGIDSSIVTALAAASASGPLKTFSVGFSSELYNELPLARLVAKKYRTEHTELMVEPDIESMLDLVVGTYDEPFADSSAIPTYLICQKAAQHVRVVLTGDGGDEAFCGYDRYRAFAVTASLARLGVGRQLARVPATPGRELRSLRTRLWRLTRVLALPPALQYSSLMRVFYETQLDELLGEELQVERTSRPDLVAQTLDGLTHVASPAAKANLCDFLTYLPGDLLVKIDRASMANALETRAPLLDHAVLAFAQGLPVRYKMNSRKGKTIVRETFGHLLPPELLTAPKRGFGVPMGQWLRGPLKGQMTATLTPSAAVVQQGLIRCEAMGGLIEQHVSGAFDHAARLWSLLVLERFLRGHR